jgi:hypothetical protein
VDSSGAISVYDRNLYVGVIHRGKLVQVMFDPHQHEWLICNDRGEQLRSKAAPEIAAKPICRLWSEPKPSNSSR